MTHRDPNISALVPPPVTLPANGCPAGITLDLAEPDLPYVVVFSFPDEEEIEPVFEELDLGELPVLPPLPPPLPPPFLRNSLTDEESEMKGTNMYTFSEDDR